MTIDRIREIHGLEKKYMIECRKSIPKVTVYHYWNALGECMDDFELLYDGGIRPITCDKPIGDDCLIRVYGVDSLKILKIKENK